MVLRVFFGVECGVERFLRGFDEVNEVLKGFSGIERLLWC